MLFIYIEALKICNNLKNYIAGTLTFLMLDFKQFNYLNINTYLQENSVSKSTCVINIVQTEKLVFANLYGL